MSRDNRAHGFLGEILRGRRISPGSVRHLTCCMRLVVGFSRGSSRGWYCPKRQHSSPQLLHGVAYAVCAYPWSAFGSGLQRLSRLVLRGRAGVSNHRLRTSPSLDRTDRMPGTFALFRILPDLKETSSRWQVST